MRICETLHAPHLEPHVHYLIPGGGLSPNGRRWIPARHNHLLHHEALGGRFRTVFKERLTREHPDLFAQVAGQAVNAHAEEFPGVTPEAATAHASVRKYFP